MKNLFVIILLLTAASGFSQEGVSVKGNTLTTKDIAPVWPGCEETPDKACFKAKLTEHLKANYKFPRDADGNIIRGKAVVSFNINEKGNVEILKVEGPHKSLNEEASRIIKAIPPMKPGKRAGKAVPVKYTVPFTF